MDAKTLGQQAAYPVDSRDVGLTKLEAFAMAAMQGLCSNPSIVSMQGGAVKLAHALLAELAKEDK